MLNVRENKNKPEKRRNSRIEAKKLFKFLFLFVYVIIVLYTLPINAEDKAIESQSIVDGFEQKIFHQTYSSDSKEARLTRLESFLFGTSFPSQSLDTRVSKIGNALSKEEPKQNEVKQAGEELKFEESEVLPEEEKQAPKIIYDESSNQGVIGTVSLIETKLFGRNFNDQPFTNRIVNLEEKLLSKKEISINRNKTLIERVSYLVNKTGVQLPPVNQPARQPAQQNSGVTSNPSQPVQQNSATNANSRQPAQHELSAMPERKTYSVDPNTGLLVNEQTGETVKDSFGNEISVMLPQPLQPLPQQQFGYPQGAYPYGQYGGYPGFPPGIGGNQQQLPLDLLLQLQQGGNPGGGDPGY